jgi:hypothetical protein
VAEHGRRALAQRDVRPLRPDAVLA